MQIVDDFYNQHKEDFGLELIAGKKGLQRCIRHPEVQRPGLSLSGYLRDHAFRRIMVFGRTEIHYIKDLDSTKRISRLKAIFSEESPAVFVARKHNPPKELIELCDQEGIPLFRSALNTMNLITKITYCLNEEFAPSMTCHGTLVEAFGVGVLIQGDSSVGKSEAALGLIERGHRLISDDVVKVKVKEGAYLEGSGPELTRHLMEIRGIGIINVAHIYGAVCVRDVKTLDIVVKLEQWDDRHFYDRIGLEEKFCDILGIKVPYNVLPVKPGRDVILLIETIVLNYRLKEMGYNSAKEFNSKLLETISEKQNNRKKSWDRNSET
ncbi:MAG: HPr(Ser) kinase/phosphatase [Rhabdochlamydiaceae bacterium]